MTQEQTIIEIDQRVAGMSREQKLGWIKDRRDDMKSRGIPTASLDIIIGSLTNKHE